VEKVYETFSGNCQRQRAKGQEKSYREKREQERKPAQLNPSFFLSFYSRKNNE
jgi:hypothetical protein